MLSFFEDIAKLTGLPLDIINNGYRIYNFAGKSIYIENFKSIITYTTTLISLKLKKGAVKIQGENLYIKEINLTSIVINGDIKDVEVS